MKTLIEKLRLRFSHPLTPDPTRDWLLLLGGTCVVFIVSLLFTLRHFSTATYLEYQVAMPATSTESYPAEAVRTIFETRASEAKRYQEAYPFIDPSR